MEDGDSDESDSSYVPSKTQKYALQTKDQQTPSTQDPEMVAELIL